MSDFHMAPAVFSGFSSGANNKTTATAATTAATTAAKKGQSSKLARNCNEIRSVPYTFQWVQIHKKWRMEQTRVTGVVRWAGPPSAPTSPCLKESQSSAGNPDCIRGPNEGSGTVDQAVRSDGCPPTFAKFPHVAPGNVESWRMSEMVERFLMDSCGNLSGNDHIS